MKRTTRHSLASAGVAACLLTLVPVPAAAHGRSRSYSIWELTETGARVRVRVPALELTRVGLRPLALTGEEAQRVEAYLTQRLTLHDAGGVCAPELPRRREREPGWVELAWRLRCGDASDLAIESRILAEVAPSHLHFVRVDTRDGRLVERVLAAGTRRFEVGARRADAGGRAAPSGSAGATSLAGWIVLGVRHILSGWDHLAFVLALALLARSLGELATVVTGFTVAHSAALVLAVTGSVHPRPAAVEATIGLSVLLVAAENAWHLGGRGRALPVAIAAALLALAGLAAAGHGNVPSVTLLGLALFLGCYFAWSGQSRRPVRLRAAVAFAFGLVHGLGFAGALGELSLPAPRLARALFGFNAGVEIGQLAFVAIAWPLLRALAGVRAGRPHRIVAELASAAVAALGAYAFAGRAFGA